MIDLAVRNANWMSEGFLLCTCCDAGAAAVKLSIVRATAKTGEFLDALRPLMPQCAAILFVPGSSHFVCTW